MTVEQQASYWARQPGVLRSLAFMITGFPLRLVQFVTLAALVTVGGPPRSSGWASRCSCSPPFWCAGSATTNDGG